MNAVSSPPSPRSTPPPPGPAFTAPRRAPRSFLCSDELWRAFEARAAALECSVDWLLGEAMKRLLESVPAGERARLAGASTGAPARPRDRGSPRRPPPALPPPRPPPLRLALNVDGVRTLIDRDAFVLGRSAQNANLVLRDPGVSRQHAIIERVGAAYVIVDMASTNGVVVNGTRVARAVLRPGDVIAIGPFVVHVERATPSGPVV